MFFHKGKRYGVEVKFSEAPEVTRSMHIVLQDLGLEHLWVIYSGEHNYPAHERITVLSIRKLGELSQVLAV